MLSFIARRALTAAVVAAAGAAGAYVFRSVTERRRHGNVARTDERTDVSRWEGEGGSPPDLTAAVPHQDTPAH